MIKFFKFKKEDKWIKEKESFWLNINFYWKLAVCFVLIIIFLSFLFGYYLFTQINKRSVLGANSNSSQVETIKRERIEKALEYFSLREQKSIQILNSPAPVVDPSL